MASATPSSAASATAVTTIDAQTLQTWRQEHPDLIVLDVRSAAEFESLHIAGSVNVPLPLLKDHADSVAKRLGGRTVLVCQSGVRAEQARQRLGAAGIDTATVLTGGVPGYAAAGGNVVRGKERWDLERQVRLAAGSLVLAGLTGGRFASPKVRTIAGFIGAGLTFSAATNTCAMGKALSVMPWNRAAAEPTHDDVLASLPSAPAESPEAAAS
ncbi:rhodanese-related sulfurtransferase [Arthrobacter sp. UYP6]|uniref:rhodanese-like domain-containing protein n=1 Tax=Arthrobacter sp. UYP6 TaxID=1756378 RepID=UPI00339A3B19